MVFPGSSSTETQENSATAVIETSIIFVVHRNIISQPEQERWIEGWV